jgi:XTP/dITP diphosphohydrolase
MPSAADHTVLLATRSSDKAREIRSILGGALGRIVTLEDIGIAEAPGEADIEVHDTFLANARAKADFFLHLTGMPTLADDSGLCVHALNGAPGVHSRRFAPSDSPAARYDQDRANNQHLLLQLHSLPAAQRTAHYTCAAVLHLPLNRPLHLPATRPLTRRVAAIGIFHGSILTAPRGSHGFGYDPLFLDPSTHLSLAETPTPQKNARSHRARAFRTLLTL